MKTTKKFKSIFIGLIILGAMFGVYSTSNAQLYFITDTVGTACYNIPLNTYISWYGGAGYVTGDNLNISINWGDGNIDSYPTNSITAFPSSAYMNPYLNAQHTYVTPGTYYTTINAVDNYSNVFVYYDTIQVVLNCGCVSGTVQFDSNGDAIYSWDDIVGSGIPLLLTTNINNYGVLTDSYGSYSISNIDHTATSYQLEIDPTWLASTGFTVIDPVAGSYNFITPPTPQLLNPYLNYYPFFLNCGNSYSDALVGLQYGGNFYAGLSVGHIDFWLHSSSCDGTPADIDLSLTFDPILTVFSSTLPGYIVTGNTLTSSITNVNGWIFYRVYYTVPGGTPAFTPLVFNISINVTNYTDINPTNNQYTYNAYVCNSWDPNDKSTNVASTINASVAEEIYYTVRFQNMGNADAINITITDTIDSQLDLNSFRLAAQSHAGSYSIDPTTRVVTFTFPNIMLPTQSSNDLLSQGFVSYRITENPGLPVGSELNNTAYIYFDGNAPVITNTTSNVNGSTGIVNEDDQPNFVVYPQPASEMFYISGINTEDVRAITIIDANGKAILKTSGVKINDGIYVGNLSAGMYFVTIATTESIFTEKLCIQR